VPVKINLKIAGKKKKKKILFARADLKVATASHNCSQEQ
jgi:hypothetical protein